MTITPTHDSLKARIACRFAPGYSHCGRCGMPWKFVDRHETVYSMSSACFPLCESCWTILATPADRWPYYERLMVEWRDGALATGGTPVSDETIADIRAAVMAGR